MNDLVVHCKRESYDIYIGRETITRFHYGNPFTWLNGTALNREDAIQKYRDWLLGIAYQSIEPHRRLWILQQLPKLCGKKLGCWCSPKACHGDVLIDLLEAVTSPISDVQSDADSKTVF